VSAATLDLAFPVTLALSVWREILAGRNYRNAPIALLLSLSPPPISPTTWRRHFRLSMGMGYALRWRWRR
jgi:hypothetical protein